MVRGDRAERQHPEHLLGMSSPNECSVGQHVQPRAAWCLLDLRRRAPQVVRALGEVLLEHPRVDVVPTPTPSQSFADAVRCVDHAVSSADTIGRARALSTARLPAPITIDRFGSS